MSSDRATDEIRTMRGSALRQARKRAGWSAERLAQMVTDAHDEEEPLTRFAIYAYEQARVMLNERMGERIADVLRIAPSVLLVGDPRYRDADASTTRGGEERRSISARVGPTLTDAVLAEALAEDVAATLSEARKYVESIADALRQERSTPIAVERYARWFELPMERLAALESMQIVVVARELRENLVLEYLLEVVALASRTLNGVWKEMNDEAGAAAVFGSKAQVQIGKWSRQTENVGVVMKSMLEAFHGGVPEALTEIGLALRQAPPVFRN